MKQKRTILTSERLVEILDLEVMAISDVLKLIEISRLEGEYFSQVDKDQQLELDILTKIKKFKCGFALKDNDWHKDPSVVKKAKSIIEFCDNDYDKSIQLAKEIIIPMLGNEYDIDWIKKVIDEINDIRSLYSIEDTKKSVEY